MQELSAAARNKMAAIYGLLVSIYYIIVTTVAYSQIGNIVVFYAIKTLGYILFFLLLGMMTSRIKKANGGYLEFKQAYGAVFIMILVSGVLYFVYNFIYIQYIDSQYIYKLKDSMIRWMEKMHTPDDKIEKASRSFDKQITESKTFNFGNNILSFCSMLLVDSLFGLLVGLAVKKNKPVFS